MKLSVENAQNVLEKYLKYSNEKKYKHSLEVAKMAEQLAKKWRVNREEAVISALLHDIGKSIPTREEMLMFCEEHGIEISEFERDENPEALHGKISAYLFKEEFRDGENGERTNKKTLKRIARAIESHVAGSKDMDIIAQIVWLADNLKDPKMIESILNDKRRPGHYIGRIFFRKMKAAINNNRQPNPDYKCLIPEGSSGKKRRDLFLEAMRPYKDLAKPQNLPCMARKAKDGYTYGEGVQLGEK